MSTSHAAAAPDAIERVLFACPKAHIYAVPPLTSAKGYIASQWTTKPAIFTARVRVTETSTPAPKRSSTSSASANESIAVAVLLEDPASGDLFAAAPYTHPSVVTACTDSTRFFAVRVAGDGGMKATLGVGFEERSDAFDFGVALQGLGRLLGFNTQGGSGAKGDAGKIGEGAKKRDLSLKDGEMVRVDLGRRTGGKDHVGWRESGSSQSNGDAKLFEIKGPPHAGGPLLPPPPSAADVRKEMLKREDAAENPVEVERQPTPQQLGFDDGEFGEFQ